MDYAERLIQQMLDLYMLEIEEGGYVEPVHPMLWRWRQRADDKAFMRVRRKRMRQADAQERKDVRRVKARLGKQMAEYVELAPTLQTAALIASALIAARDEFRLIAGEDAFEEYDALRERVKRWRMRALEFALREPKTQAWGEFLFEAGAWETEAEFEAELEQLAPPRPEAPPLVLASA